MASISLLASVLLGGEAGSASGVGSLVLDGAWMPSFETMSFSRVSSVGVFCGEAGAGSNFANVGVLSGVSPGLAPPCWALDWTSVCIPTRLGVLVEITSCLNSCVVCGTLDGPGVVLQPVIDCSKWTVNSLQLFGAQPLHVLSSSIDGIDSPHPSAVLSWWTLSFEWSVVGLAVTVAFCGKSEPEKRSETIITRFVTILHVYLAGPRQLLRREAPA